MASAFPDFIPTTEALCIDFYTVKAKHSPPAGGMKENWKSMISYMYFICISDIFFFDINFKWHSPVTFHDNQWLYIYMYIYMYVCIYIYNMSNNLWSHCDVIENQAASDVKGKSLMPPYEKGQSLPSCAVIILCMCPTIEKNVSI